MGHDGRSKDSLHYTLIALANQMRHVIVCGIPTVKRAVIQTLPNGAHKKFQLFVEGTGLQDVMATSGVRGREATSNHVMEMQQVLGIEAARSTIMKEIGDVLSNYGISVDQRHMMLLADVMTYKGEVLGITRFGMAKMKESVLMLPSFEKTVDHLFDAAIHGRSDRIVGVSECIILGTPVFIGTGAFKLLFCSTPAASTSSSHPKPKGADLRKNPYIANPNHLVKRKTPLMRLSNLQRHLDLFTR